MGIYLFHVDYTTEPDPSNLQMSEPDFMGIKRWIESLNTKNITSSKKYK